MLTFLPLHAVCLDMYLGFLPDTHCNTIHTNASLLDDVASNVLKRLGDTIFGRSTSHFQITDRCADNMFIRVFTGRINVEEEARNSSKRRDPGSSPGLSPSGTRWSLRLRRIFIYSIYTRFQLEEDQHDHLQWQYRQRC
ncbi:hypothetical protein INT47_004702 [Mucor saturninus]|uniref:Uncharacterized protein n=1 Tax=Mucor saturninus TaxID=64648 RepID=A0A8H7USE5_9FUNG|nr:hypothetical protein INT47_004702 [Mucor saturninus]